MGRDTRTLLNHTNLQKDLPPRNFRHIFKKPHVPPPKTYPQRLEYASTVVLEAAFPAALLFGRRYAWSAGVLGKLPIRVLIVTPVTLPERPIRFNVIRK